MNATGVDFLQYVRGLVGDDDVEAAIGQLTTYLQGADSVRFNEGILLSSQFNSLKKARRRV